MTTSLNLLRPKQHAAGWMCEFARGEVVGDLGHRVMSHNCNRTVDFAPTRHDQNVNTAILKVWSLSLHVFLMDEHQAEPLPASKGWKTLLARLAPVRIEHSSGYACNCVLQGYIAIRGVKPARFCAWTCYHQLPRFSLLSGWAMPRPFRRKQRPGSSRHISRDHDAGLAGTPKPCAEQVIPGCHPIIVRCGHVH